MRLLLPLLALTLAAACSSQVDTATQSGGVTSTTSTGASSTGGTGGATSSSGTGATTTTSSSSTGTGGSPTCTPWMPSDPGALCNPTIQCVLPGAFCECNTNSLACHQTANGQPLPSQPPPEPPPDGACCADEGMICGGFSECGPLCHCENGAWSCATPTACPPFTCPTTTSDVLALGNEACPMEIGKHCQASSGCLHVDCKCALDPDNGHASWSCSATPC